MMDVVGSTVPPPSFWISLGLIFVGTFWYHYVIRYHRRLQIPSHSLLPCKLRILTVGSGETSSKVPFVYMTWPCPYTKLHPHFTSPRGSLSIVVPAYNEEFRLPSTLQGLFKYAEKQTWFTHIDVYVVDDGSTDQTCAVALASFQHAPAFVHGHVVQLQTNLGKGAAVKAGMVMTKGSYVLFADADGATPFSELDKLMGKIKDIAIGSRAHLVQDKAVVNRSWIRNLLMHGFHWIVMVLGLTHIRDTQCGFKLFRRSVAQTLFPVLHVAGWIFDIELLLLAYWMHYDVVEIPVQWTEMKGSKLKIATDSIHMLLDLIWLRLNYYFGQWRVPYDLKFKHEDLAKLLEETAAEDDMNTVASDLKKQTNTKQSSSVN